MPRGLYLDVTVSQESTPGYPLRLDSYEPDSALLYPLRISLADAAACLGIAYETLLTQRDQRNGARRRVGWWRALARCVGLVAGRPGEPGVPFGASHRAALVRTAAQVHKAEEAQRIIDASKSSLSLEPNAVEQAAAIAGAEAADMLRELVAKRNGEAVRATADQREIHDIGIDIGAVASPNSPNSHLIAVDGLAPGAAAEEAAAAAAAAAAAERQRQVKAEHEIARDSRLREMDDLLARAAELFVLSAKRRAEAQILRAQEAARKHTASGVIQNAARSRSARHVIRAKREQRDASLMLQNAARGRFAKLRTQEKREQRDASLKLQNAARRRAAEKEARELRGQNEAAEAASTRLQAMTRRRAASLAVADKREQSNAAKAIQSKSRQRAAQKNVSEARAEKGAATTLQKRHRGVAARGAFQDKMRALTQVEALVEFYDALGGDWWAQQQGWGQSERIDSDPRWFGVTAAPGEGGSISELVLSRNMLQGVLPESFFDLCSSALCKVGAGSGGGRSRENSNCAHVNMHASSKARVRRAFSCSNMPPPHALPCSFAGGA